MATRKFLVDTTKGIANKLQSADVLDAAKSDVVVHMAPGGIKWFARAVASEFTLAGKTVDHIHLDYAADTLTVTVTVAYGAGAGFNLTYNPTNKGDTVTIACHNHVV